jgi:hypothetical protein
VDEFWDLYSLLDFSFLLVAYHGLLHESSSEESVLVVEMTKSINYKTWRLSVSMTVFIQA